MVFICDNHGGRPGFNPDLELIKTLSKEVEAFVALVIDKAEGHVGSRINIRLYGDNKQRETKLISTIGVVKA